MKRTIFWQLLSLLVLAGNCCGMALAERAADLEIFFDEGAVASSTEQADHDRTDDPVPVLPALQESVVSPEAEVADPAVEQVEPAAPMRIPTPPLPAIASPETSVGSVPQLNTPWACAPPLPKADLWAGYCDGCDHLVPCGCDDCPAFFTFDLLYLQRSQGARKILVNETGLPANVLLTTEGLDFDHEAGFRIGYLWHMQGHLVEVNYSRMSDWLAARTVGTNVDAPFSDFAGDGFDDVTSITSSYRSDMNNLELNRYLPASGGLMWLAGLRYFSLDDQLRMTSTDNGLYSVSAKNDLIGAQLGGLWHWEDGCRWYVDAWCKTGLFANLADASTTTNNVGGAPAFSSDDMTQFSFLADATLAVGCELGAGFSIRGGYQVLWATGMAPASNMVAQTNAQAGAGTAIDADSTLFFDGAFIGLEWVH